MVIQGNDAVAICRKLIGATFGPDAEPGTIRGDFGASISHNLVHASDALETAQNEIAIFFKKSEIQAYSLATLKWIYDADEELD